MWAVHDIFYKLSVSGLVPRNKDKIQPEHKDLTYYGSVFDFYMLSVNWLDRIMEKSNAESFYSNMARRKYRFMQRQMQRELDTTSQKLRPYNPYGPPSPNNKPRLFSKVERGDVKKMAEEINKRVSKYPVLDFKVLEK